MRWKAAEETMGGPGWCVVCRCEEIGWRLRWEVQVMIRRPLGRRKPGAIVQSSAESAPGSSKRKKCKAMGNLDKRRVADAVAVVGVARSVADGIKNAEALVVSLVTSSCRRARCAVVRSGAQPGSARREKLCSALWFCLGQRQRCTIAVADPLLTAWAPGMCCTGRRCTAAMRREGFVAVLVHGCAVMSSAAAVSATNGMADG